MRESTENTLIGLMQQITEIIIQTNNRLDGIEDALEDHLYEGNTQTARALRSIDHSLGLLVRIQEMQLIGAPSQYRPLLQIEESEEDDTLDHIDEVRPLTDEFDYGYISRQETK